jgi:hypothetical protein
MTEDLRLRIAQELTTIVSLYDDLHAEAENRASDQSYIPGGDAEVMLGPAARYSEWERQIDEAERAYFADETGDVQWLEIADQDSDAPAVLLVLGMWEERVRMAMDRPSDLRMTVTRAADFLRSTLDWTTGSDPGGRANFPDAWAMSVDLSDLRTRLEAVLHDGIRHDHSAAACFRDDQDNTETGKCGGRLVRRTLNRRDCIHVARAIDMAKGKSDPVGILRRTLMAFPEDEEEHKRCDQGGRDDIYRCQKCGGYYTEAEYWLAVREHYERQAG